MWFCYLEISDAKETQIQWHKLQKKATVRSTTLDLDLDL